MKEYVVRLKPILAGTALALVLTTPATAEGWSVINFSSLSDHGTCMSYAGAATATYRTRFGSDGFTGRSTLSIAAYDLRDEAVDGLLLCADGEGVVSPLLVVYNMDDDSDGRELIADRLGGIWNEVVAGDGVPNSVLPSLFPLKPSNEA